MGRARRQEGCIVCARQETIHCEVEVGVGLTNLELCVLSIIVLKVVAPHDLRRIWDGDVALGRIYLV